MMFLIAALCLTLSAAAQPQGRQFEMNRGHHPGRLEMDKEFQYKDAESMATSKTDQLDRLVTLTQKQYKKIYKFYKKEFKHMQNEMPVRPEPGTGRPDMHRNDGGRDLGARSAMQEEMRAAREEQHARIAKKYKKVLNAEQYRKWETFEANKDFRQIIEK